jgi:hypothetical protein
LLNVQGVAKEVAEEVVVAVIAHLVNKLNLK